MIMSNFLGSPSRDGQLDYAKDCTIVELKYIQPDTPDVQIDLTFFFV